jgi:P-type Ca2+ transporter type 2C
MMSALVKDKNEALVFAKGAPEVLLAKCDRVHEKGVHKLSEKMRKSILKQNKEMNSRALRTLMLAYKPVDLDKNTYSENNFIFLGIVGMEDPPREEVKTAIEECADAGIKVKMITGDNKITAISISRQVGLEGKVLVGLQLDDLSDAELAAAVKQTVVFARVKPEHKLRIVKALKQNGEIVTMTGDGVNDAPALKEAHIGVAMGKNGTDVTRSVSDLILKDDNFATIVSAVKEGRTIFNNIRKFVSYQLSDNYAELFIILIGVIMAPIFGWPVPLLLALHILFMNLVTDNLPAITLGLNPYSRDVMQDPPRKNTGILTKPLFLLLVTNGTIMGTMTLLVFYVSFNILGNSVEVARTTALVCLIVLEVASAFNFRSFRQKTLTRSPFVNPISCCSINRFNSCNTCSCLYDIFPQGFRNCRNRS